MNMVRSVSRWSIALAMPKSITLGTGLPSCESDQDVGGLDVAVDDPLLVGVLDRLADADEQLQPLGGGELVPVAVVGDGDAVDQLHDEVGPAGVGGAGVEHLGDVRVVHQGQGLSLGLEAGDHLVGIHTGLDDLQGHSSPDGTLLLGHVDDAHAPFADLSQELVGADAARASDSGQRLCGREIRGARSSVEGGGRLWVEDRCDPGVVVGETSAVLAGVGSLATIPAQLHLQGYEFTEEGDPLRRVGLSDEVLDSRRTYPSRKSASNR